MSFSDSVEEYVKCSFVICTFVLFAASLITFNLYLIALASFSALASFVVFVMWGFIDAFLFQHTNFVQVFGGWELSGDRVAACSRRKEGYTAVAAAIFEMGGMGEVNREQIERMIANSGYPFKFVMQVEQLNLNKLLDDLQTRRSRCEIELSRIGNLKRGRGLAKANIIRRKIEQLEHDIKSVTSGSAPLRLAYYVMVGCTNESRPLAEETARAQASAIANEFDSFMGSRSHIASGDELVRLLKIDSMVA